MPATEPDGVDAVGLDRLIAERRSKADALRTAGIEPFPNTFPGRRSIAEVRAAHEALEPGDEGTEVVRVAGRLTARRGQGKVAFLDLEDRDGRIQVWASIDRLGECDSTGETVQQVHVGNQQRPNDVRFNILDQLFNRTVDNLIRTYKRRKYDYRYHS